MTHDQLIVAQSEAFTILRDLMHMKADDPRPQRIINTIKQTAMAILRLKPIDRNDARSKQPAVTEIAPKRTATQTAPPQLEPRAADPDPTAHLSDEQFTELLTHLPDLNPTTDKRRMRLARYLARFHLGVTPDVKAAIFARADRLGEALQRELSARARVA